MRSRRLRRLRAGCRCSRMSATTSSSGGSRRLDAFRHEPFVTAREAGMRARAEEALARIRAKWGDYLATYEGRPDLVDLRRRAGL